MYRRIVRKHGIESDRRSVVEVFEWAREKAEGEAYRRKGEVKEKEREAAFQVGDFFW